MHCIGIAVLDPSAALAPPAAVAPPAAAVPLAAGATPAAAAAFPAAETPPEAPALLFWFRWKFVQMLMSNYLVFIEKAGLILPNMCFPRRWVLSGSGFL